MDNFKVGKRYLVNTQRKGKFTFLVTSQDETWVSGVITNGRASAFLSYNEKEEGEEVTLRKTLIYSAVEK